MTVTDISIIIVNYNTTPFLINCLSSIKRNFGESEIEVVVIDNNSPDKELGKVSMDFQWVKFFFREINDGFAGGCNYGVRKANGKYLLFMNPDVTLNDNSVMELKTCLEKDSSAGIVSGIMSDYNNATLYFYNDFPSLHWEFYNFIGMGIQHEIMKLNSNPNITSGKNFDVDWFHGAFFMIRKKDFEEIKGFNEEYLVYYEDVDICFKVKHVLKKKNICIPSVKYYHFTQSSLNEHKNDDFFTFHMNRGKLLFIRNYGLIKKTAMFAVGLLNVLSRITILPFWSKYKGYKKRKFFQLLNVLKLYFSKQYLDSSKYVNI